jgi:hypothetical protein
MRIPRFTVRRLMMAVGVLACGLALVAVMIKGPEEVGAAEAERDIAAGILRLKTYGLPAPWFVDYQNLMKSRLGVEIKPVAGCVVTDYLTKNAGGYNRRMNEEIARRFGARAHDQIVGLAQKGASSGISAASY